MSNVFIKLGDTAVVFTDQLLIDGSAIDLSGATVRFVYESPSGVVVRRTAATTSAAEGRVSYTEQDSEFQSLGTYTQEWEVTDAAGKVLTFPTVGYNSITVKTDIR